ncbi:unnamed protein product, partial [Musa hybrid cultivar]
PDPILPPHPTVPRHFPSMTSRIVQGKPPGPPRSPSNKKENLDEAPLDKRHRF